MNQYRIQEDLTPPITYRVQKLTVADDGETSWVTYGTFFSKDAAERVYTRYILNGA